MKPGNGKPSTATEFNTLSGEKNWNLILSETGDPEWPWQGTRSDGARVFRTVRERDAVVFANICVEVEEAIK